MENWHSYVILPKFIIYHSFALSFARPFFHSPGSNPGVGMWQGSGRPSRVSAGFIRVLRFPPPRMIAKRQHPRL